MDINQRLFDFRQEMKKHQIDAYIIPSSDPHNSEYVADRWKSREWVSGFSGSAGIVIISQDHAGLWTDSRYFLQAEKQLANSQFVLHKVDNQFVAQHIKWLYDNIEEGATIGFDGMCMTKASVNQISNFFHNKNVKILSDHDLIENVWTDRPSIPTQKVYRHSIEYAGKTSIDKIKSIQNKLSDNNYDGHLITSLDDIAWIFNIRGTDVQCNPVAICYAIIERDRSILFVNPTKLDEEISQELQNDGVILRDYTDLSDYLKQLDKESIFLLDPSNCSNSLYNCTNAKIESGKTISRLLKAVKNKTEIENIRHAMAKDGAALTKAFMWLESELKENPVSEYQFVQKLAECRATQDLYKGESFGAIVGYKGNGAIIHYSPDPHTSSDISMEGILLCDSGGQYLDGTTDITRTIALGTPNLELKKNYTLVLKGMIALTNVRFPEGTAGGQLEVLAKQFLWEENLNFMHGTGHGVGFFLNVHEAPQGFAPISSERGRTIHVPGMITSNEPGYYKEGAYGIRIENLILTIKNEKTGFLEHETLTVFPIDIVLIELSIMTEKEKNWFNDYHDLCYERISPLLNNDEKEWLKNKCRHI